MKTRRFTALEKIAGEARLVDKVAVYDDKGCKIDQLEHGIKNFVETANELETPNWEF